jgi:c-di-GMP-binding flagellar brake protein YcgR
MNGGVSQADAGALSLELPAPAEEDFTIELKRPDDLLSFELTQVDRREKPRHAIQVQVRIRPEGDAPLEALTADLSAHGLAITAKRPLNVEQECSIELGISAPQTAHPASLRASVRYCARLRDDEYRIGMKFTDVSIEAAEAIVVALGL